MKRDEMLKIMSEAYGRKNYIYFDLDDADRVLTAMEKAGMAPPNRCEVKKTTFIDSDGEDQEFEYEQYSHTWEKE